MSRTKRPELEREEPIRHWSSLFGPRAPGDKGGADAAGAATEPVSRGVETGYRVIDEYIREGQDFARRVWSPLGSMTPPASDPQKLSEQMFQSASELATAWLRFVQAAVPGSPSAPSKSAPAGASAETKSAGGFDIDSAPSIAGSDLPRAPSVDVPRSPVTSVEIKSNRRVEVSVDLKPGSQSRALLAHRLRAPDAAVPPLPAIVIECHPEDNRVAVRVQVPRDQPPGVYSGLVVDEHANTPQGSLSVQVFE
jgi:hypothetical protein